MVRVLFTRLGDLIPQDVWLYFLEALPPEIRRDVNRYIRWQDRQSRLLGKLLLRRSLVSFGYDGNCLELLGAGPFGRPMVPGKVDFNISHSAEFVVCAATDEGRVGIDVEKVRPIELQDFYTCMSCEERRMLASSKEKARAFFSFWTKKESALKADGRGLILPMQEARIEGDQAVMENTRWHLRQIDIDSSCMCHLASSFRSDHVLLEEAPLQALL